MTIFFLQQPNIGTNKSEMKLFFAVIYSACIELKRIIFKVKHSAMVDITDRCNLRCIHCYHFNGKDNFTKEELKVQEWEQRFLKLYLSGIRFILIVGGEPALRIDVLMLASGIFPFVYVITNGTIKIPEKFNHRLFVSLDGTSATNDLIRGKGVYQNVLENYVGDNRVVLNMTLTNKNIYELEEVIKISMEYGLRGVVCNIYATTLSGTDPIRLSTHDRIQIIDELRRVKKKYPKTLLLSPSMIDWYAKADHRDGCYWGSQALHYTASWERRKCFANADCSNCGCLGGAYQSPRKMLRHPGEMIKLI